ncbi:DUF6053 domain-containing protein [Lysobacter enzymogenes]|uniref:DUF6053 domain-containing protein n=1 Tax=Lysobacter enzymogenes TaxID=69 RepID=UPI00384C3F54
MLRTPARRARGASGVCAARGSLAAVRSCGRGFSPDASRSGGDGKPHCAAIRPQSVGAEAPPTKAGRTARTHARRITYRSVRRVTCRYRAQADRRLR